jgi:D-alanyl-D-alanine carboxypeptidase
LADEKCNAAYPDIPGLLDAAQAHFKDGPLPYTYTDPKDPSLTIEGEVDASSLAQFIFSLQGNQYGVFGIPSILNSLAPPDQKEAAAELLGGTFAPGLIASRDQTKGEEALLMHLAVVCSDDRVRSADDIILDGASEWAIDVARAEAATYVAFCPLLNVTELPEGTDENVSADIPTLLLSGGLDVATPPLHSQLIADALPNATHVIFPTHTHDQVGGLHQCVKEVYTQFIADPSAALDTSCVEARDPKYVGFSLPDGSTSLAPTEEPETSADSLWSHSWQWVSFTNPAEQYDIDLPENYVLTFYEDDAITIVADCNTVLGEYTDDDGALTITPGPSTLVACSPESRSDQFVQLLEGAARYFFEDGNLYIDLKADGGTLTFAPVNLEGLVDEDAIGSNMPEDLVAQLDAFLQSQVYSDGGDPALAAPGLVLLVDTPAGRYLNAAGVANLEDGTPMKIDDILQIGSNTKSMTIVLLMQLVEEGLLTLDDTLDQWLPEQAALFPNGDQMTLRQLAQHTAGLWDYGDGIIGSGVSDPVLLETSYTPDELVQYAAENGTPYFAPGAEGKWQYSNTGYILLGMIIEKVSGQSLSELYQTRIFDPLGMESAVLIEGVPQPGEITSHGYWFENGESVDTTNWNASQGWAAGAVAMNAADLATYAHRLAMGDLFQNPDTLAEMLSFDPSAKFGVGAPYGLGLLDVAGDGTVWGHGGQTLGFQSLWFTDPADGIVVVGLTNSASYSANNLINVRHILQGEGAQPLGPLTLLPLGQFIPTSWAWTQFVDPADSVAIDAGAGLTIDLAQDQSVTVKSAECGEAYGTYTTDGTAKISFELDDSSLTCDADSLAGQLVQYLKDAARWHFANGNLVIELLADGGSLIFANIPPQ